MCTFLTAWGDALFSFLFVLYSLAHFLDIYSGLACRAADIVLPICLRSLFRGTPILAGGIGVARFCGVVSFGSWFSVWAIFMSVLLLVTRLGLMPCSAWSKKKVTAFD